jgi:hypothetical protein
MNTTICGHERETLRRALSIAHHVIIAPPAPPEGAKWTSAKASQEVIGWYFDDPSLNLEMTPQRAAAVDAAIDPAKLACIISDTLRDFGVDAHSTYPATMSTAKIWVTHFPRPSWENEPAGVSLRPGALSTVATINWTMVEARAVLLRLLQLPDGATPEDALREVKAS